MDNEVRLIDVFVDSLALERFGFQIEHCENGWPAYHPRDLLKLFIYGYMNKIRSSRQLEYIETKLAEYYEALAQNDGDNKEQIEIEIAKQRHQSHGQYAARTKSILRTNQFTAL